jgi:uncharacterized membrane protein
MYTENPPSTASVAGHPLHAILVPFPIVCFVGTFVTDLAYWQTTNVIWETFSVWLLTAGLVIAGFAAFAGLIDFLGSRQIRALKSSWPHVLGNTIVLLLSLVNVFIHSRDGYTAVVPTGLILSTIVVVILLFTGWMGRDMVYRQRVGVVN